MLEQRSRARDTAHSMQHSDLTGRLKPKDAEPDLESAPSELPGPAEAPASPPPPTAITQAAWLLLWTMNNIFVTVLNKTAFSHVDFNYPYALSVVHMACNSVGAAVYVSMNRDSVKQKTLNPQGRKMITFFSLLFAANIAVGNNSLRYVSVNFNQVMRSLVPGVTMLLGTFWLNKSFSAARKVAVIPIMIGVAMATYGELRFTMLGFAVTVLCVILAALKVVVSGEVLTGARSGRGGAWPALTEDRARLQAT